MFMPVAFNDEGGPRLQPGTALSVASLSPEGGGHAHMVHQPIDKNHTKAKPDRDQWLKYVPSIGVLVGIVRVIVEVVLY